MSRKILYYVDGPWPSAGQRAEAASMGASIRNARLAQRPERCDYVAGAVPACCAHLPRWEEAQTPPEDSAEPEPVEVMPADVWQAPQVEHPPHKKRKKKRPAEVPDDGIDG